jgi:hypothetical protein
VTSDTLGKSQIAAFACLLLFGTLIFPILDLAQSPGAQSGTRSGTAPRDALDPRMYAQISGQPIATVMIKQHDQLIGDVTALKVQNAALQRAVDDLGHRLDLHRTEIDAMQPEVQAVDVARLKQDMQAIKDEKAAREAERKSDRDAMMGWFRGIGSGVLVAIILIGINALIAHRREGRQSAKMLVLKTQTDGMTERISQLSEAKGHADERAGIDQTS